jgi:UDP-N-acetylmuramoyl-tripeptide--D-alanyl-D-alanine ligase
VRAAEVADVLITVGERARIIAKSAKKTRRPNLTIFELENSNEAIEFLMERLTGEDVALIKGSRGMNMDRIVSELEKHE